MAPSLRILELFSGIGGMHLALKESQINAEVIAAIEVNNFANEAYCLNFPGTKLLQRNIESVTASEIAELEPDMILMSPPCQPFSRNGKQLDVADTRSMPLLHLIDLLPLLYGVRFILLENVVGFAQSEACQLLVQILGENLFECQEFHLSPDQFHIPNSRPRYYLLAKRKPWSFKHKMLGCSPADELPIAHKHLPETDQRPMCENLVKLNAAHCNLANGDSGNYCYDISHILEELDEVETKQHKIPKEILKRYIKGMDVVHPDYTHSCCFTKAYRRYHQGSGSILFPVSRQRFLDAWENINLEKNLDDKDTENLLSLNPRFFTPREIARLMCFPDSYKFPSTLSHRQITAMLGNSINVHVVGLLIAYLTEGDLLQD